jgi:hypothetical protein
LGLDIYDIRTTLSDDVSGEELLASIINANNSNTTKIDTHAGNTSVKPAFAENGHLAQFDSNRNVIDSGKRVTPVLGHDDATVPTSKAVRDVTDTKANANLSNVTDDDFKNKAEEAGVAGQWGLITGTLSDQTDLQDELDNKPNKTVVLSAGNIAVVTADGSYDDSGRSVSTTVGTDDSTVPTCAGVRKYVLQQQLLHTDYIGMFDYFGSQTEIGNVTASTGETALIYIGARYDVTDVQAGTFDGTTWGFVSLNPPADNGTWLFAKHLIEEDGTPFGIAIYKNDGTNPSGFDIAPFPMFQPDKVDIDINANGELTFKKTIINTIDGDKTVLNNTTGDNIMFDTENTLNQVIEKRTPPFGGLEGQVLVKASNDDFDMVWGDATVTPPIPPPEPVENLTATIVDGELVKTEPPYPPDLVFYLDFDNPAGALVPRVGTATITDTGTLDVEGFFGRGRRLEAGTTARGLLSNQRNIPQGRKTIRLKIMCPISGFGSGTNAVAIIADRAVTTGSAGMVLRVSNVGTLTVQQAGSAVNLYSLNSNSRINDGIYHDVIFSWTGTTETKGVKIYIDGVLDAVGTAESAATAQSAGNMALFSYSPFSTNYSFWGDIDEIEISNTVKTPDDFPRAGAGIQLEWNKSPVALPEQTTHIRHSRTHYPMDITDGEFLVDTTSESHLHLTNELPQFYSAFGHNVFAIPHYSSPRHVKINRSYGAKWHKTLSPTQLERTYNAQGMRFIPGTNAIQCISDFDSVYPWSEMRLCNVDIIGGIPVVIAYEGEPGFTRNPPSAPSTIEVMREDHAFYYEVIETATTREYLISEIILISY